MGHSRAAARSEERGRSTRLMPVAAAAAWTGGSNESGSGGGGASRYDATAALRGASSEPRSEAAVVSASQMYPSMSSWNAETSAPRNVSNSSRFPIIPVASTSVTSRGTEAPHAARRARVGPEDPKSGEANAAVAVSAVERATVPSPPRIPYEWVKAAVHETPTP